MAPVIRSDGNGGIVISKGMAWVVGLVFATVGLGLGQFVPRSFSEHATVQASQIARLEEYVEADRGAMREAREFNKEILHKLASMQRQLDRLEVLERRETQR